MNNSLFKNKTATDVVTAQDIRQMTGISGRDFQFPDTQDPDKALNELLESWVERIASHIYIRIDRSISEGDGDYPAIQDVLARTVANLVAVAQQQRSSPVVQVDNFAVNIINTSEVTKKLDDELEPFIRYKEGGTSGWAHIFSSIKKNEGSL